MKMEAKRWCYEQSEHDSRRSLVSDDRGWVNGLIFSSYCYVVLFIMAFFFLLSGVLFTAISYRPQEVGEKFGEWSFRLAESRSTKVAGPAFIILGFFMSAASIILCQVSIREYDRGHRRLLVTSRQAAHLSADTSTDDLEKDIRNQSDKERRLHSNMAASFYQEENLKPIASCNQLIVSSDIACFPDASTPRSSRLVEGL